MNKAIRVLLICLLFSCQYIYAVEVEHLYEAEVVASSNLEQDRQTAIKQALEIVLSRVIAGDDILQNDVVKTVLANASHYVREFQYSLIATDNNDNARLLRVKFNEQLLVDVLKPGKLGFWNEIRSKTLVWLVVEDKGKQMFFDAVLMPEIDSAMERASKLKALPIIYPMQDLEEKRILSISDVLSAYSDHLLDVSLRYDVVSTLAGKVIKQGACWEAEWTHYFDGKIKQWRGQCASIDKISLTGFNGIYGILSRYYAVKPDIKKIESVILKVSNIKDTKDTAKVTDYFDSLPMINTATWLSAESGYNVYRIFYQGERQTLNETLVNDRFLRVEDFSNQNSKEVKYKLISK